MSGFWRYALVVAGVLSACSTEYTRPPPPVPDAWPATVNQANGQRSAVETDWHAFFSDPRLQVLISAALEHNRDLRIAIARVEEARSQYGVARADAVPTVNATGSRNAARTSSGLGGTNTSITGQRYDFSLTTVSYEVDFWSRVSGMAESARASYLASEEASRAMRLSLISDVANTYFSQLEMTERAALAQIAVTLREKTLALVAQARESGFASNLDYLQAETALHTARAEVALLEREAAAAANALQLLVGKPFNEFPAGRPLGSQDLDAGFSIGIPSEVLLTRPDVRAAEQRLVAAHASVGSARAAFLPRILLTATLGVASRALAGLFSSTNSTWAFQPSISAPLFDGGRTAANVDVAEARKIIAVAEYEKTIQQAFREVADLLATRTSLAQQGELAEANAKAQGERVKIAQALFLAGQTGYLDVLDAQREHFSAQQTAVQVRKARLATAAQLYKALGGGGDWH